MDSHIDDSPRFGIRAVGRATGIPVETLRVWERRYGCVAPHRADDKRRYYTADDVRRLQLIKQLVDAGHTIGSVARLSESELMGRLDMAGAVAGLTRSTAMIRVLVGGELLPSRVADWNLADSGIAIVGGYLSFERFARAVDEQAPDVLIWEMAFLAREQLDKLAELMIGKAARVGAAVYSYAAPGMIEEARRLGLSVIRAPLTDAGLVDLCARARGAVSTVAPMPPSLAESAIPPRRFDAETLSLLSRQPGSIRCECPRHVAELVFRVSAFERYSADCENRNQEDAAIHAKLRVSAAQARALLEDALEFLIETEGLDLSALAVDGRDRGESLLG